MLLTGVLFLLLPSTAAAADSTQGNLYFGLLHAHTAISGGDGSPEAVFSQAAQVEGLDFFAATEHSHSLDNAGSGAITSDGAAISNHWATGKAAAKAVTGEDFVGIFGYEMSFRDSDYLGHISTFGTPGWVSRNQEGFDTLTAYYDALTTVPGSVSQFNHPGPDLGDFQNFSHRTDAYDAAVSLIEVGRGEDITGLDAYLAALGQGWHVAPTLSWNSRGLWQEERNGRTVVLAEALSESSLYQAMGQRRVYATEDKDLQIFYTLNESTMGSILPFQEEIAITATLLDPTDSVAGIVEVLTKDGCAAADTVTENSGTVRFSLPGNSGWYFLRIIQPDGDTALTAPIWIEDQETSGPPTEPAEPGPPENEPTEPEQPEEEPSFALPENWGINPYFGLLHAHSVISDGAETAENLFAQAAEAQSMDFFAVTDHSNSFENDASGAIGTDGAAISADWAQGKAAAKAASTEDFTAMFGYEMTWPDDWGLGHITTFNTPGWISRNREGFGDLESYYEALTTVPGSVSVFCHPGPDLGEFGQFSHRTAAYDEALSLLEFCGEEDFQSCSQYSKALDAGWHVAPAAGGGSHNSPWESSSRTVLLAEAPEEAQLYEAMANHRAYATQDTDLTILCTLDGTLMGGVTTLRESHTLRLLLSDPTDSGGCTVKVLTRGGRTAASAAVPSKSNELTLQLPGGEPYYFLHITQQDGDIAVTAPVWAESYENVGISDFSADTDLPIQGQPINLTLTLFNEEQEPFVLDSLELRAEDRLLHSSSESGTVDPAGTLDITVPCTWDRVGSVHFQVQVTGTINGISRSFQAELALSFRPAEMVKGLLVDTGYSGLSSGDFENLCSLAAEVNLAVTFLDGALSGEGNILILPPPQTPYSPEFLQQVKIFCARGGSVVICGGTEQAAASQNLLLQTLGSSLRLLPDHPVDARYPTDFNRDTLWCETVTPEQYYVHLPGCAVEPGRGTWLVEDSGASLLCWETLSSGSHILAGGSLFLCDDAMPQPKNMWDTPTANQTIAEALLGIHRKQYPITPIADVRRGEEAILYRIKGYTTSGTANKFNTFPDTIYLQDDTGGIAIVPFREQGIAVGTPMEVLGYLREQEGNPVLMPVDYHLPEEARYRYVPETLNHSRAMDYEARGGQLLQIEAEVTTVTLTEDGKGISRFTLVDAWGDKAVVMIEDGIRSGAYGTNTLASEVKIGRTVRAIGILHLDSNGIPVLRVRNCEEVVWVPPIPRPGSKTNPYTGDRIFLPVITLLYSGSGLLALRRRRKK